MTQVIVVGLYRSGTNFTQTLVDVNLKTSPLQPHPHTLRVPYKHAINEKEAFSFTPDVKTILVYKTPDRWLASIQRLCYELPFMYDLVWEEGHTPIVVNCDSEVGRLPRKMEITCSVEKLLNFYRDGLTFWLERADFVVRYEDVLFDTENQLMRMSSALGVPRKDLGLSIPQHVPSTDDWTPARKEAYREPPKLDEEVESVLAKFDFDILAVRPRKNFVLRTKIHAYPVSLSGLEIVPADRQRDWLDKHAYRCLPLNIANEHGWDLVTTEDILVWTQADGTLAVEGCQAECHFGMKTFTLPIGVTWHSPYNVQMMLMPVPNDFNADWSPMTAIIETDSLKYPVFVTVKALSESFEIPKGTPLARMMPVTIAPNPELHFAGEPFDFKKERIHNAKRREDALPREWLRFYHETARFKSNRCKIVDPVADKLMIVNNFLSDAECDLMMETYNRFPSDVHAEYEHEFWRGRSHHPEEQWPKELKEKFALVADRAQAKWGGGWIYETWQMTTWPEGFSMKPHADYADGDYPHRDYAAVIYFNDGYEGGNIYFPDFPQQGSTVEVKPEKGMLIVFPGGDMLHGVKEITNGTRLTAITWLTRKEI